MGSSGDLLLLAGTRWVAVSVGVADVGRGFLKMPRMVLLDQKPLPVGVSTPASVSRRATLARVAPCSRYQANIWRTMAASYSSTRKPEGSRGLSGSVR